MHAIGFRVSWAAKLVSLGQIGWCLCLDPERLLETLALEEKMLS